MDPLNEGRDRKVQAVEVNSPHMAKWLHKKNLMEEQRRSSPLVDKNSFNMRKSQTTQNSTADLRANPAGKVIAEQMLHATKDQEEYFNNKKVMQGGKVDPKKKDYKE